MLITAWNRQKRYDHIGKAFCLLIFLYILVNTLSSRWIVMTTNTLVILKKVVTFESSFSRHVLRFLNWSTCHIGETSKWITKQISFFPSFCLLFNTLDIYLVFSFGTTFPLPNQTILIFLKENQILFYAAKAKELIILKFFLTDKPFDWRRRLYNKKFKKFIS